MYLFHLAERLHMTIEQLLNTMSSWEFQMWICRDKLVAEERAKQIRIAKQKNRKRGDD